MIILGFVGNELGWCCLFVSLWLIGCFVVEMFFVFYSLYVIDSSYFFCLM